MYHIPSKSAFLWTRVIIGLTAMPTNVFFSSASKVVVVGPRKGDVAASVWRYLVVDVPLMIVFTVEMPR
jgi:hypothetical protein